MKKLAIALMAMSAMIFGFGMVAEAQYGAGNPGASVPSSPVPPGGTVTITITGCVPGEVLTVTLNGAVVATATCVASAGSVTGSIVGLLLPQQAATGTATITFPAPANAGSFTYQVTGTGGFTQSVTVTVGTVPGTGLPSTGSGGVQMSMLAALGLLGVGAALFGVSQVRRRSVAAA